MERYEEIEKSIIKTYRKSIWKPFIKGIQEFEMIQEGDKIAVCMSGGKDSSLLAKCMQELKRHRQMNLEFIQCACRFTEHLTVCGNSDGNSKRAEVKELINQLRSVYDKVDMNIYNSTKNVNLNTLISYIKDGEVHHFMDDYDEKE